MKISAIKTYVTPASHSPGGWTQVKPFILVKVETDEGLEGWGEAYGLTAQERAIAQLVKDLGSTLIGSDPRHPRTFAQGVFFGFGQGRENLSLYAAQSGLEMALWDITGKALGQPVHQLLGGASRDRIPLYANLWSSELKRPGELAEAALAAANQGFDAVKAYPLRSSGMTEAETIMHTLREALGPRYRIMVDLSGPADPRVALEAAQRFQPYDPFWIEEPLGSHDVEGLVKVKERITQRVVSGERLGGLFGLRRLLEKRAADVINPDAALCGGLVMMLKIAALAEAHSIGVSPHNYASMGLGLAAMAQVSALIPNFVIGEYFPAFQAASDRFAETPLAVEKGQVSVPTTPGLGINLKEAALQAICV